MKTRHKLKMLAAAAAVAGVFSAPAQAAPVALELALLVDVSGSVDATEYNLQKQGYINAFNDAVIQANITSLTGGIAVTYIEWSGSTQQSVEVPWTLITDATSSAAFATAIGGATRNFSGSTAPGSAINYTTPLFSSNAYEGARWVIDVSGDGEQNDGANTAAARNAFLTAATGAGASGTINGLCIGGTSLCNWYQANIVSAGGFLVQANDFADFDGAVRSKIGREIIGVPVPATAALLGIGLMAVGAIRRRKAD